MRFVFALFLLASLPGIEARAEVFCYTTSLRHCDPNDWVWYPRTVPVYQYGWYGLPYGRAVKLSGQGEWIDRSGHRVWAYRGTRRATVLSELNTDERNGELAYQAAYDSYLEGQQYGANSVQNVKMGRWRKRIVTGDGIVLYKDRQGNVAVQSPDGKWHTTGADGLYASTSNELVVPRADRSMVAKGAKKDGGRAPASVKAEPAKEDKPAAEETAKAEAPGEAGEGGGEDISGVSTMDTPAPAPAPAPVAEAPKADAAREPASSADPMAEMVKQAAEDAAKKTAEAPATPAPTAKQ